MKKIKKWLIAIGVALMALVAIITRGKVKHQIKENDVVIKDNTEVTVEAEAQIKTNEEVIKTNEEILHKYADFRSTD